MMLYLVNLLIVIILAVVKVVCLLVAIAYFTLAERKIMASVQRRVGPNVVGPFGLLQPLADGLKLLGKELAIPAQASSRIFLAVAMTVLLFALSGWSAIPFGLFDHTEVMNNHAMSRLLFFALPEAGDLTELEQAIINFLSPHPDLLLARAAHDAAEQHNTLQEIARVMCPKVPHYVEYFEALVNARGGVLPPATGPDTILSGDYYEDRAGQLLEELQRLATK